MTKRTIEDWDRLTFEEKKRLSPEELEELFHIFDEWYGKESPKQQQALKESFEHYLARFTDIDTLLDQKSSTVDILFLRQDSYLDKLEFIEHLKGELKFYVRYFDFNLDEEEFDNMYDRIADIESRYKWILAE